MTEQSDIPPDTVSKILWHFTGGPVWNEQKKRQGSAPKAAAEAFSNLKSILRSRELRLGRYREIVRVTLPEKRIFDRQTGKMTKVKDFVEEFESAPVCCLSDIPVAHLSYHARRYGKFAIGFHRDAVVAKGFNPVFYSVETTNVLRALYRSQTEISNIDVWPITNALSDIESAADDLPDDSEFDISSELWEAESAAGDVESLTHGAREALEQFIAFVKTFNGDEFSSIYCEREWRSTDVYRFDPDDVAMVVVPRQVNRKNYFEPFVTREIDSLNITRTVPVVPWEDLVEH